MPTAKEIQAEQHVYKQEELIVQVDELSPEIVKLFQTFIEQADVYSLAAGASVRKLVELDADLDLEELAKQLAPIAKGKPLVQVSLVRQLLKCSEVERSRRLLLLLMEDYWIAQSVLREMQSYGRDDAELIDRAEAMLPTIKDKPAVSEMKYWIRELRG